jgi:hypothetical protein
MIHVVHPKRQNTVAHKSLAISQWSELLNYSEMELGCMNDLAINKSIFHSTYKTNFHTLIELG